MPTFRLELRDDAGNVVKHATVAAASWYDARVDAARQMGVDPMTPKLFALEDAAAPVLLAAPVNGTRPKLNGKASHVNGKAARMNRRPR